MTPGTPGGVGGPGDPGGRSSRGSVAVLLVDDDPRYLKRATAWFEGADEGVDLSVLAACSAAAGVSMLEARSFDCVVATALTLEGEPFDAVVDRLAPGTPTVVLDEADDPGDFVAVCDRILAAVGNPPG